VAVVEGSSRAGGSLTASPGDAVGIERDPRRRRVLAILCLGLFMLLLDGSIVNLAIPSVIEESPVAST
jgi:hypothetical protein